MAGVLSRAVGRIATTTRSAGFVFTTVTRPTFPARPTSPIPRLIHTEATPSPVFPSWFREQVRVLVKEEVAAEMKQMRATCLDRYEILSGRVTSLSELSATRHAECMTMHIKTQARIGQVAFRVCVSMIGLAAASQYQDEIGKILLRILGGGSGGGSGGDPPSQQEVAKTVQEKLDSVTNDLKDGIALQIEVICARHFLEEQEKKDRRSKE